MDKVKITRSLPIKTKVIPASTYEQDLSGTLLDPRLSDRDGYIDLQKELYVRDHKTNVLVVPSVKLFEIRSNGSMDDLTFKYNYLLQHLEQCWYNEATFGYADWSFVQKLINALLIRIGEMVTGKWGLLRRHIMGTRVINSARAAAVPNPNLKFGYIGVPASIMHQLKLSNNDFVLLIRHPVLWEHNILCCKVHAIKHEAIECHPTYCRPLGLDFDGDCVAVIKVPTQFTDEAKAVWVVNDKTFPVVYQQELANYQGSTSAEVSFSLYVNDLKKQSTPTLQDFIDPQSKFSTRVKTSGKYTVEKYMEGLSLKEYLSGLKQSVTDQATIKLMLPLAGAFSIKLRYAISLAKDPELMRKANCMIEKVCQEVLDVKHSSSDLAIKEIIAIFERRNKKYKTLNSIIEFLSSCGVSEEYSRPVVQYMLGQRLGLTDYVTQYLPIHMASEGEANVDKLDAIIESGKNQLLSDIEKQMLFA